MLATSRRRVNLNSERNDRAPGFRLQDIREVETCVQKEKFGKVRMYCSSKLL
jgi:hypothetical protein